MTGHAYQIEVADVAEFPKQGWFVDTIFPQHQAFRYKKVGPTRHKCSYNPYKWSYGPLVITGRDLPCRVYLVFIRCFFFHFFVAMILC